jgi:uncharacterized protein
MQKSETDKITQIVIEHIPSVLAVYLFGSHAVGLGTENSDVDIAFLTPFEYKSNPILNYRAKQKLEVALGRDVDFIHLNQASTVFQFEITTTAMHLYVKDASMVLQYEALVLSMYQRLQEERKDILDQIILSGKVYA